MPLIIINSPKHTAILTDLRVYLQTTAPTHLSELPIVSTYNHPGKTR